MVTHFTFSASRHEEQQGSALVLTLMVVSLLMVVVLAFSIHVRLDLRQVREHQQRMLAQAHARLGAMIALGELQEALGPDMRVSARAEILTNRNPDHSVVANASMRHWTGVWNSEGWDPGDPNSRQNRFNRWLVSMPAGSEDRAADIATVGSSSQLADDEVFETVAVMLAGDASGDAAVRAGIQHIPGPNAGGGATGEIGRYAWWVSDEGVKANLAMPDPYAGLSDPQDAEDGDFDGRISEYLFPHRPNLGLTEWFGDLDFSKSYGESLSGNLDKISGLLSSAGLAFQVEGGGGLLADVNGNARVQSALREDTLLDDYTIHSHGVMSSTRRGGLRGDLSLAFWEDAGLRYPVDDNRADTNVPFENDFRFQRIFSPADYDDMTQSAPALGAGGNTVGALNPWGPRWEVLRDFHNSFQKITTETDGYQVVRAAESDLTTDTFHEIPARPNRSAEGVFRLRRDDHLGVWSNQARSLDTNSEGRGNVDNVEYLKSPATPVLTRFVLEFTARLVENPDQTAADIEANGVNYRPEIRCYMFATLWNPYNVAISLARNTPGAGGSTRGEVASLGRPAMMIGMFANQLEMFEFEINGETWNLGGDRINQITGDWNHLLPSISYASGKKGTREYTNFGRWPWEINDVRLTNNDGNDALVGADPYTNSDWEAGEVRVYSLHTQLIDNTRVMSNTEELGQPGVLSHFFTSVDNPGWHAWRLPFKKKLGFWDDDNAGFAPDALVDFHFRPTDTSTPVQEFNTAFHGYSSNSGNVQRPFQMLSTNMDLSELPAAHTLRAGDDDEVTLGFIEFSMKPGVNENGLGDPLDLPVPRYANFNPRAFIGNDGNTPYGEGQNPLYWFGTLADGDRLNYLNTQRDSGPRSSKRYHRGYFGVDHTPAGKQFIALFDLPRRPVESLGQYQHAMLSAMTHQPAYPFGNSLADIHVPRSGVIARYEDGPDDQRTTYMDTSWLLNDSLWDDYFLSTINPYVNSDDTRLRPQRNRFVELDPTVVYNRGDSSTPEDEVGYSETAGNLLLRGAFNVNSTSVEAWKTVIATLGNDGIPYLDPLSVTPGTTGGLEYPFYRLSVPLSEENRAWTGAPRNLTDLQVTALAESIVEQVEKRGPFLSISDFVNRRIGPDSDDRTLMGALQAAIEAQGNSIQNLVDDVGEVTFGTEAPRYWQANLPDSVKQKPLAFAPGDLTQADLLTTIGPALAARSDTFVIRSMGSVSRPGSTGPTAKSWCEMVVQRMPEAVEPDPGDPTRAGPFGRRFRIVGARYLTENEL